MTEFLKFHVQNLKKHIEKKGKKKVLNKNKMGDSFAFEVSLKVVDMALEKNEITASQLLKALGL